MKLLKLFMGPLMVALAPQVAAADNPLSQQMILELNRAGLGDEAIIAKIAADGGDFGLSVDDMLSLRQQGLSSAVIAAMVNSKPKLNEMPDSPDPMVPHPAGTYLLKGQGAGARMVKMNPTASNQVKTGGIWGSVLTGGIASVSVKAVIPGETASVKAGPTPTFFFFFDGANASSGADAWASGANTVVTSPAEFSLVELKRKDERREARVGSRNLGGTKAGVMDSDRVDFSSAEVRPGVFRVTPVEPLKRGEYGFLLPLSGGAGGGVLTARIFDFSVE